jgi:hypothetical protein
MIPFLSHSSWCAGVVLMAGVSAVDVLAQYTLIGKQKERKDDVGQQLPQAICILVGRRGGTRRGLGKPLKWQKNHVASCFGGCPEPGRPALHATIAALDNVAIRFGRAHIDQAHEFVGFHGRRLKQQAATGLAKRNVVGGRHGETIT